MLKKFLIPILFIILFLSSCNSNIYSNIKDQEIKNNTIFHFIFYDTYCNDIPLNSNLICKDNDDFEFIEPTEYSSYYDRLVLTTKINNYNDLFASSGIENNFYSIIVSFNNNVFIEIPYSQCNFTDDLTFTTEVDVKSTLDSRNSILLMYYLKTNEDCDIKDCKKITNVEMFINNTNSNESTCSTITEGSIKYSQHEKYIDELYDSFNIK